jgi:ribokinase
MASVAERARVAVVGHVEWSELVHLPHLPSPGDIVQASDPWEGPAGGGAVAAVQLARLAGDCLFFTALGDDPLGHRAERELEQLGVRVAAAWRAEPQRRAFVQVDANAERTITVIGRRLAPQRDDPLPWSEIAGLDAVYLTAGDADAVRAAREARRLVASVRAIDSLADAGIELDALVSSRHDRDERYPTGLLDPPPALVLRTDGARGGSIEASDGRREEWAGGNLPGRLIDAYGAGDSFAAGFTYGLGINLTPAEAAALGARWGAACVTGRGPYAGRPGREAPRPMNPGDPAPSSHKAEPMRSPRTRFPERPEG